MKKFRLDGVVGLDFTAASVAEQLDGAGDVEVTLNSPGGDVMEGMAIYNAFNAHAGAVKFVIDQAMSMASIIMLAGDERIGRRESSMIMIHRPWGLGAGNADEMRATADVLDKMQAQMTSIYEASMTLRGESLAKMLDDETYLDADEAMALGLLTSVVSGSKNALHKMAFAALADDSLKIDRVKYAAKVKQIDLKSSDFCNELKSYGKLSEIEASLRTRGLSRAEATAVVSAVKRLQGDPAGAVNSDELTQALKFVENFKL
jgi:ATP-dependent Clp endopeptidase proteolytic subunit ClpP